MMQHTRTLLFSGDALVVTILQERVVLVVTDLSEPKSERTSSAAQLTDSYSL
jgi:hypothetical protein